MNAQTLLEQPRTIARLLHQAQGQYAQVSTAVDAQWQEARKAYEEART